MRCGRGSRRCSRRSRRSPRADGPEKHLVQPAPDARLVPVSQPAPARHPAPTPHLGRQVLQGDARLQHEQDPRQRRPVRHPEELAQVDRIDWDRAALDSAAVPGGGQETGKNPTDRGKQGTKRHLVVDAHGIPLAVLVSAANVHDSKMMLATVDAIEPIRAKTRGRPRRRPHKLHADKGYDCRHFRLALRKRRIIPRIARCGVEPKNRLGRYRWVVERTLSSLNRFRR